MIENVASDVRGMTSNAFLVWGAPTAADGNQGSGGETNGDEGDDRRVLVDCGANFDAVSAVREHADALDAILLTHTHPDHVGTLDAVRAAFDAETFGFDAGSEFVDTALADGETVAVGTGSFEVIHTPGHKDDHVCLYEPDAGTLFAGDLVFAGGGFGRTDLAEGHRPTLIDSVERLLDRVGPVRELHTGHGPSVTEDGREAIRAALRAARR